MKSSFVHTLTLCATALSCAMPALAADTVALRKSVRLATNSAVVLADIAVLDGSASKYADIEVGRTDTGAFEMAVDTVRQKLVAAGADLNTIKLVGDRVVVRPTRAATTATAIEPEAPIVRVRSAMEITRRTEPSLIEPARFAHELTPLGIACSLVGNAFDGDLANVRLAIQEDDLAKLSAKPSLRYELVAKSALRCDRVNLEVIAYEGAKIVSRDRIKIEPRIAQEVIAVRCDVRRGESIDTSNSTVETRFIAPSDCDQLAQASGTLGSRATKSLHEGALVSITDVERPLAVRRNERIMVRREIGMVAIEFEALALEDGVAGDVIAVEQAAKGRRRDAQALSAEVIAPGRAVVR